MGVGANQTGWFAGRRSSVWALIGDKWASQLAALLPMRA